MKNFLLFCFIATMITLSSCGGDGKTRVLISTNLGDIKILLYDETPLHKDNFIKLAKAGEYDGTLFHRVIPQFMIQGGDPDSKTAEAGQALGMGGPGYKVPAEIGFHHFAGALAAARDGNPEKASSGSQFYIVTGRPVTDQELNGMSQRKGLTYSESQRNLYKELGGAPALDGDYTVFGEVLEGMEVVVKIADVAKNKANRPNEDVKMTVKVL